MTELATLEPPDTTAIEQEGQEIVARAEAFIVESAATYETAGKMLLAFKSVIGRIKETLDPIIGQAHKTHKALTSLRGERCQPFQQAEAALKSKMGAWHRQEQERVRREQEAALAKQREEEAERERKAEELRKANQPAAAAAFEAVPVPPAPVVQSEVPKLAGVSTRRSWTFDVVDKSKLPLTYLVPDEKAIRKVVNALGKQAEQTIPGIRVTETTTIAGRTT